MMWSFETLEESSMPGDKGVGLRELLSAGLKIPPTVVVRPDGSNRLEAKLIYDHLRIPLDETVIVRSSVIVPRASASAVSGLYPSRCAKSDSILNVLDEVYAGYSGPDRAAEAVFADGMARSTGMVLLVQPFIQPSVSGVAHIVKEGRRTSFFLSVVSGHLSDLVEGYSTGLECELVKVELGDLAPTAIIAQEEVADAIAALPNISGAFDQLFHSLSLMERSVEMACEIEWAAQSDKVWFLQSQPLTLV